MNPQPSQLTTTAGNPVADNQNSLSAGARGPLLLQDYQLIEKLAHLQAAFARLGNEIDRFLRIAFENGIGQIGDTVVIGSA